jgi:hypothetical protein
VILFCTATGVSHAAVGVTAHAMQSMAIKGFIVHETGPGGGRQRYEATREAAMAAFKKTWE